METSKTKYVAYYRVSTKKQESNNSLEYQQNQIKAFAGEKLINEFTDVDSGSKANKRGLNGAIAFIHAYTKENKDTEVVLIATYLDRLTRSFTINTKLTENKIKFTALDSLNDSQLIIDIKTSVNADFLRNLKVKTEAGQAVARAKGKKIGSPQNLTSEGFAKGLAVRIENSLTNPNNVKAWSLIEMLLKVVPKMTLQAIADKLNKDGFKTSKGYEFTSMQVKRLIEKYN